MNATNIPSLPILYTRAKPIDCDYRFFVLPDWINNNLEYKEVLGKFLRGVIDTDSALNGAIDEYRWAVLAMREHVIIGLGVMLENIKISSDYFSDEHGRPIRGFIGFSVLRDDLQTGVFVEDLKGLARDIVIRYVNSYLDTIYKNGIGGAIEACLQDDTVSIPVGHIACSETNGRFNTSEKISRVFPSSVSVEVDLNDAIAKASREEEGFSVVFGLNNDRHAQNSDFMNAFCKNATTIKDYQHETKTQQSNRSHYAHKDSEHGKRKSGCSQQDIGIRTWSSDDSTKARPGVLERGKKKIENMAGDVRDKISQFISDDHPEHAHHESDYWSSPTPVSSEKKGYDTQKSQVGASTDESVRLYGVRPLGSNAAAGHKKKSSDSNTPSATVRERTSVTKDNNREIASQLVTQAEYLSLINNQTGNGLPITGINWYDAVKYCEKLGSKEGRKIRLPYLTELENITDGHVGRYFEWTSDTYSRCDPEYEPGDNGNSYHYAVVINRSASEHKKYIAPCSDKGKYLGFRVVRE